MTTIDDRPVNPPDEPEPPTNRPPSMERVRMWLRRPYAKGIVILTIIIGLALLPLAWLVLVPMNVTGAPASAIMQDIETTVFWFTIVSVPIVAFVYAVLVYSLVKWRGHSGDTIPEDKSPAIRTNIIGVVLWTAFTSALAFFLVVWGLVALAQITQNAYGTISADQQPGDAQSVIVNVTAQQWVWTFQYPQHDNVTTDVLYLPKDRPIYFNVTSKDVIHNFWLVELGVKIDANPGAITQTGVTPNKLGTFNLRCAELCGMHHAYMETSVEVLEDRAFNSVMRELGGGRTS
jgi:cytochrome c oxidase subunit 2